MIMAAPEVVSQIDDLLTLYEPLRKQSKYDDLSDLKADAQAVRVRYHAAINRLAPVGSAYFNAAQESSRIANDGVAVAQLHGIMEALRADVLAGYLKTVEEAIHAEVFADFLEMATELLAKGYKDPAAVLTGSVLEEHLRKLAAKLGIPTDQAGRPRAADTINADLAKAGAYNLLDQKGITSWLDLRNKAAHGHYSEYESEQVRLLVENVRAFLVRHPA